MSTRDSVTDSSDPKYGDRSARSTHPIPSVHVSDFGNDPLGSDPRHTRTPAIVREACPPPHPIGALGFNGAKALQITARVRWWLREKILNLQGTLHPRKAFGRAPPRAVYGRRQPRPGLQALALCRSWNARMSDIESAP